MFFENDSTELLFQLLGNIELAEWKKATPKEKNKNGKGKETPKPLSEVLSGMRGGNMSLDQVKNAVAKCTSLHVTTKTFTTNSSPSHGNSSVAGNNSTQVAQQEPQRLI